MPEQQPKGPTVPLREHFEKEIHCLEEKHDRDMAEIWRRLEGLENALEKVAETRNEYLRREVYDQRHDTLTHRMDGVEKIIANYQGRFWAAGAIAAIVGALAGFLTHFLEK